MLTVLVRPAWAILVLVAGLLAGCNNNPLPDGAAASNTLFTAVSGSSPRHLDPTASYWSNETPYTYQIYEPPYGYHYLKRPYELIPKVAAKVGRYRIQLIGSDGLPCVAPKLTDWNFGVVGPADTAYLNAGVLTSSSAAEMIGKIAGLPMVAQPGVKWRYSAATDIQGYIIEKLSGLTLAQFMGQRIFAPLGMTDTGFYVPPAKIGRLAGFYDADPATGKLIRAPERGGDITIEPGLASGGGGLISTAQDLARFAQMILNNGELNGQRLLKPETVALMRANHLPDSFMVTTNGTRASPLGTGVGFGLDWAVWMDPQATGAPVGAGTVSWGGSAGTWFWIDPKNDLYFIGMIQRQGGTGGGLDAATRSLTYQALVDPAQ